ncbi:MAG: anhydro-N-acetylmuramic acid kinase [Phycisphaerales bacterium]
MPGPVRHIIGCMTGTSLDALDAAIVRVEGAGLSMRAAFIRGLSRPLGGLSPALRRLADQEPVPTGEIARLSREFSVLHAEAVRELAAAAGVRPDLLAVHGQTIFHAPPVSWQLFNPAPLAEAIRTPVVLDLRAADLARGGQGAPITPIADWILFADDHEPRAIVNLGGFCNITILPAGPRDPCRLAGIEGFDVCAGNHLLDAVARVVLRSDYDVNGAAALAGEVLAEPLEDLVGILRSQAGSRRSLGTGDEALEWVSRYRAHAAPNDLAATACEALGQVIAHRTLGVQRVLLAGGGAKNAALVRAISGWASARVERTDDFAVPIEFREAVSIAVLGALCEDRVPITLPRVTGVSDPAPVSGVWAFPP